MLRTLGFDNYNLVKAFSVGLRSLHFVDLQSRAVAGGTPAVLRIEGKQTRIELRETA